MRIGYIVCRKYLKTIFNDIITIKKTTSNMIPYIIDYRPKRSWVTVLGRLFTTKYALKILKDFLYFEEEETVCIEQASLAYVFLQQIGKICTLYIGFSDNPVIYFHAWVVCDHYFFFEAKEKMQIICEYHSNQTKNANNKKC